MISFILLINRLSITFLYEGISKGVQIMQEHIICQVFTAVQPRTFNAGYVQGCTNAARAGAQE